MSFVDGYVKSPLAGIAPWVLLSIVSGPGRFEEAASAALALTVVTLWVGWRRGVPVHALEVFGAVFFAVLSVIGLLGSDAVIRWLELWAGEVSNIALALFAIVGLAVRKPFTVAYAKDTTPPDYWATPLFRRINVAITGVWAASFAFSAILGAVGTVVFGDGNGFWTGWILPLAGTLFAIQFTEFYPDYAAARFATSVGEAADPVPSALNLVDWLPVFILVTGIVGLVSDSVSTTVGVVLIVVGAVGAAGLRVTQKAKA